MLSFFKNLTKKSAPGGQNGEPPIMRNSPMHGSFESVGYVPSQPPRKPRPVSEIYDTKNNGFSVYPMQTAHSFSLEESQFQNVGSNPMGHYQKNGRKPSDGLPKSRNTSSNISKSQSQSHGNLLQPLSEEPSKFHYSPKCMPKLSAAYRSSGHSRSHSSVVEGVSSKLDKDLAMSLNDEEEAMRGVYKKHDHPKVLHSNTVSADSSFDDSSTENSAMSRRWSDFSLSRFDPVPPPRKKRSRDFGSPQLCNGSISGSSQVSSGSSQVCTRSLQSYTGSPQVSSGSPQLCTGLPQVPTGSPQVPNGSIQKTSPFTTKTSPGQEVQTARTSTSTVVRSPSIPDPGELSFNLPPGLSDLELDILSMTKSISGNAPDSKPELDLVQNTLNDDDDDDDDDKDTRTVSQRPENINSYSDVKPTLDNKTISREIKHLNDNTNVLPTPYKIKNEDFPQKQKLRSETIVQSIFGKGRKQSNASVVQDCEEKESNSFSNRNPESDFRFGNKDRSPESDNIKKSMPQVSKTENSILTFREYCEVGAIPPPPRFSEPNTNWKPRWNEEIPTNNRSTNNRSISQPDVLFGTHGHKATPSLTSLTSVTDSEQENKSESRINESYVDLTPGHDLTVFHQLSGVPLKTAVKASVNSTVQDIIKRILQVEKLPPKWYLYKLCIKTLDAELNDGDGFVEFSMRDCPLKYIEDKNCGENVVFELRKRDGIQIRVTCEAGFERPKTSTFRISCEDTCARVLEIVSQKLFINNVSQFCLIQVDRTEKVSCAMKRVEESQIIAELHTDYFLLCERDLLAHTRDANGSSRVTKPDVKPQQIRSSLLNPTASEVDVLKRRVASLEEMLIACGKEYQQKLKGQQSLIEHYRKIAFCTCPGEKVDLFETELQKLTKEMKDQQEQVHLQRELCNSSNCSEKENLMQEERLREMEEDLQSIINERNEIYDCLFAETSKSPQQTLNRNHGLNVPSLYSICCNSQGRSLYALELHRSTLTGTNWKDKNTHNIGTGLKNGGLNLTEGDRILEINGQLVHHLNEKELLSVVKEMNDKLHVVVLKEENPGNNIYML